MLEIVYRIMNTIIYTIIVILYIYKQQSELVREYCSNLCLTKSIPLPPLSPSSTSCPHHHHPSPPPRQIQDAGNYLLQALRELQMFDDDYTFQNGAQVITVSCISDVLCCMRYAMLLER